MSKVRNMTAGDWGHAVMGLIVILILCFWVMSDYNLTQRCTLALLLCAFYLFVFWRKDPEFMAAQERPVQRSAQAAAAGRAQGAPAGATPVAPVRAQGAPAAPAGTGNLTWFQIEAATINKLLRDRFKIDARINLRDPAAIVEAYGFTNFTVTELDTIEYQQLRKVSNDLARAINASPHREFKYGDVKVLAHNSQPIVLQVTHPDPKELPWSDRPENMPLTAALGVHFVGTRRMTMQIDLGGDRANGAIMGAPGGGKSIALRSLLIQLIESTPANLLQVWGIDLKADVFKMFEGLPHLVRHTGDVLEAKDILQDFAFWTTAAGNPQDGVIRLLIIDEFQDLTMNDEHGETMLKLIDEIMRKGREFGVRVLIACQLPDGQSFPTALKSKTHWMASSFMLQDNYLTKQLDIYGASALREKGEMVYHGPDMDCTLAVYWLPKEQIPGEIDRLRNQYGVRGPASVNVAGKGGNQAPVVFPLSKSDPLTPRQQKAVSELGHQIDHQQAPGIASLNLLCHTVYGSKNPDKMEWIKEALRSNGWTETVNGRWRIPNYQEDK